MNERTKHNTTHTFTSSLSTTRLNHPLHRDNQMYVYRGRWYTDFGWSGDKHTHKHWSPFGFASKSRLSPLKKTLIRHTYNDIMNARALVSSSHTSIAASRAAAVSVLLWRARCRSQCAWAGHSCLRVFCMHAWARPDSSRVCEFPNRRTARTHAS